MAGKRRHKRIIKRLNTEFSSGGESLRGTSSNLSEGGLFLRTQKPLPADSQVDVSIQMPDAIVSRIKGTVRWSLKSASKSARSGMGIEIGEYDRHYVDYLNAFLPPPDQIVPKEHRRPVQVPPAVKAEQPASQKSGAPALRRREPAPAPKSTPPAAWKMDDELEDSAIDSLLSSILSKGGKKQDET